MSKKYLSREECRHIQISILCEISRICEENNLFYSLAYGSMLGAVRHKGFIPWDDDIDIFMPRLDYDKFLRLMKNKIHQWLDVFDDECDGYYYPFAKAVDKNTMAKMEDNLTHHGLWIDVFPIDNIPDSFKICKKHLNKCKIFRAIIIAMTTDFNSKNLGKKALPKKILSLYADWAGKENIYEKYRELVLKYKDVETEYVGCLSSAYITKERMKKTDLFSSASYQFEQYEFKGIKDYDTYLLILYGDYMKLPPEDKRRIHSISAWDI